MLEPELNSRTSVQTYGAQLAASNNGRYLDVYNQSSSGGLFGDLVPYLDPRNWNNHLRGDIYKDGNSSGHSWDANYGENAVDRAEISEIIGEVPSIARGLL